MIMDIQQTELADARRGTLYFLGNISVNPAPSFDFGLVSNFVGNTEILHDLKDGALTIVKSCDKGRRAIDGIHTYTAPIRELFTRFFDSLIEKTGKLFGETAPVMDWVGEFASWAISSLVGSLESIVPGWGYVQNAADLYSGIKQSITSAIKWLGQCLSGYGVKLLEGGPVIMAQALARHSATGLAGGLKDIAVTSTKIGLQTAGDAAAGVGSIINALTGILQRIANLVGYCIQRVLVGRALDQARTQWIDKGPMLSDAGQFLQWFKRTSVITPIIPSLTLMSGFVGHPYRFLKLITEDDEIIDQKSFDKGVDHIDKLKSLAKDYAKEWQDSYKLKFTSSDNLIASRIADL